MSQLLASIQADRFRSTMRNCAAETGLRFDALENDFATLILRREDGGGQMVFFSLYDSTIEFLVPTDFQYDSIEEVPDFLSTHLLKANESTKLGFWALKQIGDQHCYAVMYNIEINLLTPKLFGSVLSNALAQVEDMYRTVRILTNSLA